MNDYQDAYGQVLYSFYRNEESFEIFERDDGFIELGDPSLYFTHYNDWPPHQQKALRYARGRILDVGCGAGRHTLYLQEEADDVVGIDISPLAVRVCRLRGVRNAQVMSITQVSSKKLGIFDTVIMLGNNFGLFGSWKRAKWLLKRLHNMTSEEGRIIGETLDPHQTTEPAHLTYQKHNLKKGRMAGQARIRIRYKKHLTPWMDYLFVSKDEMQRIVQDTGWGIKQFIDSKGSGYVAVIEKDR